MSLLNPVGGRVPVGKEPLSAPVPVVPPFSLHPVGVGPEVKVLGPGLVARVGRRSRGDRSAEPEFMDGPFTAGGTVNEEGHSTGSLLPSL